MFTANPLPFGACFAELLARRNLSASSVSQALGHKSRTTLRRILKDQANLESIEKFYAEFTGAKLIQLTAEEESDLQQALEVSRLGLPAYLARKELWNLLVAPPSPGASAPLAFRDTRTGGQPSPDEFAGLLSRSDSIRLLLLNTVPAPLIRMLVPVFNDSKQRDVSIEHYFFLNDDISRTIRFISDVFPILQLPSCSVYAVPHPRTAASGSALSASVAVLRLSFPDGSISEYQLGFPSPDRCLLLRADSGIYDFWAGMLTTILPIRVPIKHASMVTGDRLMNYLQLIRSYADLELNNAIYMIKPGLCLSLIAPHILDAALRDGLSQTDFRDSPEIDEFISRQHELHQQRFDNIYQKKRVTHILIPYKSLHAFAQTGRLTDHFFGMRPFTLRERREILTLCRNQTRDNPYLNIYFFKDVADSLDLEAACYEPAGVLIHSAGTSYKLSGGHAGALITLSDFSSFFCAFFRETLMRCAHSAGASVAILNALIDELPETE